MLMTPKVSNPPMGHMRLLISIRHLDLSGAWLGANLRMDTKKSWVSILKDSKRLNFMLKIFSFLGSIVDMIEGTYVTFLCLTVNGLQHFMTV